MPFEVSSDVQLVVCMGVRRFFGLVLGGATGFLNVMMQMLYFVFAAALLHKVDLVISMQKMKFMV